MGMGCTQVFNGFEIGFNWVSNGFELWVSNEFGMGLKLV